MRFADDRTTQLVQSSDQLQLSKRVIEWILLGGLYCSELCLLLVALTSYVVSSKPNLASFLDSRPGYLFISGLAGFVVSGLVVHRCYVRARAPRTFRLIIVMNVLSVFMALAVGEMIIRATYQETSTGDVWGKKYLYPREWDKVVRHFQTYFRNQLGTAPYHVFDDLLGWTIAPSRTGNAGLYQSSVEGIRSPKAGIIFKDRRPPVRVALIGDSYTFAEEVSFGDSWGHQLETLLGPDAQVLNFGVMGYGVGQAYLRYLENVLEWKPDVVIFGFIDHDLVRTMGVYSFLTFAQSTTPFPTPRFVMTEEGLRLLNTPLPSLEQIFSAKTISELPYVNWDPSYVREEWERPLWTIPTRSYLFRWLESWYAFVWDTRPENSDEEMRRINRAIFDSFRRRVEAEGGISIIAYLPSWGREPGESKDVPLGLRILSEAGIEHIDVTNCLSAIPFAARHEPRGHYSPLANLAVARCLQPVVIKQLDLRKKMAGRAAGIGKQSRKNLRADS
jgi:hypothetical protein